MTAAGRVCWRSSRSDRDSRVDSGARATTFHKSSSMPNVLITTVPFAQHDQTPVRLLEAAGATYVVNPLNRRLKEHELANLIGEYDAVIAGTEPITDVVMERAERLKLIARVGIGLDSVDLHAARRRGIRVSYTPDAPARAVSDLTIGLML